MRYLYTIKFYLVIKKNEILSFADKWMQLTNIILSKVRFRRPKVACFLSYVEYRPNTNTAILQETDHGKKRSHTREGG
jgi:hypothetical protein